MAKTWTGLCVAVLAFLMLFPALVRADSTTVRSLDVEFITVDSEASNEKFNLTLLGGDRETIRGPIDVTTNGKRESVTIDFKTEVTFDDLSKMTLLLVRPMYPHNLLFGKHNWTVTLRVTANYSNGTSSTVQWPNCAFGGHTRNTMSFPFSEGERVDQ